MKNIINENLTNLLPIDITAITGATTTMDTKIEPAVSEITPEQKKDYQQIGPKLESVIRLAKDIAHNFPGIFPAGFTTDRIDKSLKNFDDFTHIQSIQAPVNERIEATIAVNGIVAADEMNYIYEFVRIAASKDPALMVVAQPMIDYYKKGPKKGYTPYDLAKGVSVEIHNAVPGTRVTNTGTSRISMSDEGELGGITKILGTVYIDPAGSYEIPAGVTAFVVRNLSSDDPASFTVKQSK